MLSVAKVVEATMKAGAVCGTYFAGPAEVIRVTRRRYDGKIKSSAHDPIEFTVTIGRPNYRERLLIRQMRKAGEPFPVKRIQWTWMKDVPPRSTQT